MSTKWADFVINTAGRALPLAGNLESPTKSRGCGHDRRWSLGRDSGSRRGRSECGKARGSAPAIGARDAEPLHAASCGARSEIEQLGSTLRALEHPPSAL